VEYALRKYARGRILDIGCGQKPYEGVALDRVTARIGFDVEANPSADVHGDATSLPFGANEFDTVLCTQVLEHVAEPQAVFKEVSRVLKPGGLLILTAPQYWELHEEPHDYFRYTFFGLQHLLSIAGMKIIEHQTQGHGSDLSLQSLNLAVQHWGEKLPFGHSLFFRATKVPFYTLVNVAALLLKVFLHNERDVMNHLIVAEA